MPRNSTINVAYRDKAIKDNIRVLLSGFHINPIAVTDDDYYSTNLTYGVERAMAVGSIDTLGGERKWQIC